MDESTKLWIKEMKEFIKERELTIKNSAENIDHINRMIDIQKQQKATYAKTISLATEQMKKSNAAIDRTVKNN